MFGSASWLGGPVTERLDTVTTSLSVLKTTDTRSVEL